MSCQEQQEEELEVLDSIYEGDEKFKKINATCFQYKYGEDGDYRSFLVEITWQETYPEEAPTINLELFYNKHIMDCVKEKIRTGLQEQVDALLSTPMTFSLFEWIKDNLDSLLEDQPETAPIVQNDSKSELSAAGEASPEKKKEKKEQQMSKAQKRKFYDKYGANTDRPRGWDWVDVVKHLSQTGSQPSKSTDS